MPTYLKAGFRIYDAAIIDQFVPDECDPCAPVGEALPDDEFNA